jgi:hypothetical protein
LEAALKVFDASRDKLSVGRLIGPILSALRKDEDGIFAQPLQGEQFLDRPTCEWDDVRAPLFVVFFRDVPLKVEFRPLRLRQ